MSLPTDRRPTDANDSISPPNRLPQESAPARRTAATEDEGDNANVAELVASVGDLLERPGAREVVHKLLGNFEQSSKAAHHRAVVFDIIRAVLFVVLLGIICWLASADKIEGQAVTGLLGGLVGYLVGRKPGA